MKILTSINRHILNNILTKIKTDSYIKLDTKLDTIVFDMREYLYPLWSNIWINIWFNKKCIDIVI
jgi:hypothetical protein